MGRLPRSDLLGLDICIASGGKPLGISGAKGIVLPKPLRLRSTRRRPGARSGALARPPRKAPKSPPLGACFRRPTLYAQPGNGFPEDVAPVSPRRITPSIFGVTP